MDPMDPNLDTHPIDPNLGTHLIDSESRILWGDGFWTPISLRMSQLAFQ